MIERPPSEWSIHLSEKRFMFVFRWIVFSFAKHFVFESNEIVDNVCSYDQHSTKDNSFNFVLRCPRIFAISLFLLTCMCWRSGQTSIENEFKWKIDRDCVSHFNFLCRWDYSGILRSSFITSSCCFPYI